MAGFMGMGMAMQAGGANPGNLYTMGMQGTQGTPTPGGNPPAPSAGATDPAGDGWVCVCGQRNTGKFCSECGAKRPDPVWICRCNTRCTGKFCPNCGAKRPE